jgi:dienelactone hydrolase
MRFTSETTSNGVSEQDFTIDDIPGVLWSPDTGSSALILLGHGGGQHKKAPGMVGRARRYVAAGFAVAAIDAPGHGDRPKTERDKRFTAELRARMAAGEPVGPMAARGNAERAALAVPEWQATVDALHGDFRAIGYFGISMGGGIGIPFVAADNRVTAAVFGLTGHETEAAAKITVPVEFLLQWDDELVPRDSALALFDAFASAEKTLHANPGGHGDVPRFEVESSVLFFTRHLTPDLGVAGGVAE